MHSYDKHLTFVLPVIVFTKNDTACGRKFPRVGTRIVLQFQFTRTIVVIIYFAYTNTRLSQLANKHHDDVEPGVAER